MTRAKTPVASRRRRREILKEAKGYRGARSRRLRVAKEALGHSGNYAYRDRKRRKGDFRKLWIVRINAACRENEISYSRFIAGLKTAGIELDRKILAETAAHDPATFSDLVERAKKAAA